MKERHITIRTLLQVLAGVPTLAAPRAVVASPAAYSLALRPSRALLGEPLAARLVCVGAGSSDEVVTFDDSSLTLTVRHLRSNEEAAELFPNHQVFQRGNRLIRMAPLGRRRLGHGERLVREFDLARHFPELMLDPGEYRVAYEIRSEASVFHVGPSKLTIESGPDAVPALFALLDGTDAAVRSIAAAALHVMTGHVVGYRADADSAVRASALARWQAWWSSSGKAITWNYGSVSATFGVVPPPAPAKHRSLKRGGLAYRLEPLKTADADAMVDAIAVWKQSPARGAAALRARERIADQVFNYPGDGAVVDLGDRASAAVAEALDTLSNASASLLPHDAGAAIVLETAAKCLSLRLRESLYRFAQAAKKNEAWRRQGFVTDGLIQVVEGALLPRR